MSEELGNALQEGSQGQQGTQTGQAVTPSGGETSSQPAKPSSFGDALRDALNARSEGKAAAAAAPETADDDLTDDLPDAADDTVSGDTDAQPEAIRAPESWSKEDRAAFDALDEAGRKVLLGIHKNMEGGLTRKMEELAKQRNRYKGMDEFFEAFHGVFPQTDRTQFESQVMQSLPNVMNTYLRLQQNPVETLEYLAQAYGVTDKLSDALIGRDDGERKLKAQNVALEDKTRMLEMQKRRESIQAVEKQITEFREATNEDGTPKHPYFDELEPVMSQLIQSNRSLTIEQAYEKAVRMEKSDELLAQERERVKREMEEERRRKAKAARAQVRPAGGRTGATVATDSGKAGSLRDELMSNLKAQLESTGA